MKGILGFFKTTDDTSTFAPALITTAPGTRELAFIVDENDDGSVTVFFPLSPMGAAVNCLMHWGLGSRELFTKKTGANAPEQ